MHCSTALPPRCTVRASDGYLEATQLCRAAGRPLEPWLAGRSVRLRVFALQRQLGLAEHNLVQREFHAGQVRCWLHPQLAQGLERYLPAGWVPPLQWQHGQVPEPVAWVLKPSPRAYDYFSLHHELLMHVLAPLRQEGFPWPDTQWPGERDCRAFDTWLAARGVAVQALRTYRHQPARGPAYRARLYPYALYPLLRQFVQEQWLQTRIPAYFLSRQPPRMPPLAQLELPEWRGK